MLRSGTTTRSSGLTISAGLLAHDDAAAAAKRERYSASGPLRGFIGTVSEAIDPVGQYRDPGIQLLINSDYRNDMEMLELFASEIMPQFA